MDKRIELFCEAKKLLANTNFIPLKWTSRLIGKKIENQIECKCKVCGKHYSFQPRKIRSGNIRQDCVCKTIKR